MTGVTFQIANLVTKRCVSIPFPPNVRVNSVGPSLGLAYDGAASRKFKVQPVGRIVTMDVAREVVYDIATPRCDGMYPDRELDLYEMDGSLCFASQMHFPFSFKIWVLKDLEKGEWMERYSIDTGLDELNYVTGDKHLHRHNCEPVCKIIFCRRKDLSQYDVNQWQSFVYESISWWVPSVQHVNTLVSWEACNEED
ncbi:uncharacterized protein LOC131248590 isoform X1 [Magnolia sinica]|uniref:uncharacterized protein LOC131248590 isoform X1 n=1 Tax=Magnolia sinica TaxID=86752 RepID=UPI002659E0E1|nr:uncharacterized protein LOC131248590 isoform X1 [Magnolia sinica]